jgi:hypothetical protein
MYLDLSPDAQALQNQEEVQWKPPIHLRKQKKTESKTDRKNYSN